MFGQDSNQIKPLLILVTFLCLFSSINTQAQSDIIGSGQFGFEFGAGYSFSNKVKGHSFGVGVSILGIVDFALMNSKFSNNENKSISSSSIGISILGNNQDYPSRRWRYGFFMQFDSGTLKQSDNSSENEVGGMAVGLMILSDAREKTITKPQVRFILGMITVDNVRWWEKIYFDLGVSKFIKLSETSIIRINPALTYSSNVYLFNLSVSMILGKTTPKEKVIKQPKEWND